VSQKVFAIEVALWKSLSGFLLQDVLMIGLDGIPVLFMTLMKVVDGREVKILLMPAENRLPSSNITVRIRNAFNEHWCCIPQKRIKICKIPASGRGGHQGLVEIGAIDWGSVLDGFPKLG
jgi:hypothetical protein